MTDDILDAVFLSYNKILYRLKIQNITTKGGKEITHKDLRCAIDRMDQKHPTCRWKFKRYKNRFHYVLIEGYYWLVNVYFQKEKSLTDADVAFFEKRIKQYKEVLNIKSKTNLFDDINVDDLEEFFERKIRTIKKAMTKIDKNFSEKYITKKDEKTVVKKEGIELLCKNCFKQKYLELLEDYKMELTQKYIDAGYIYDYF